MNVSIVCSDIMPGGGTERAISNTVNMLASESFLDISIYSLCSDGNSVPYYTFKKCKIHHLNLPPLQKSFLCKIKWYIKAIIKLRNLFLMVDSTIFLSYGHNVSILMPFVKRSCLKAYACEHINFDTIPSANRLLMRLVYPLLDGVLVLSETAKRKMKNLNNHLYVIPNSISFSSNHSSTLTDKRMIMLGRLSQEKGYERLVPIAKYLSYKYPDWEICIYGDGPLKDDLCFLYKKEGLTNFLKLKGVTKDVQKELLRSSIFLMTSYTEALPMVLIEAKACGVPSVAYRCEGTEELIDCDGYLVDDINAFVAKVGSLLDNYLLRRQLGERALENSKKYSIANIRKLWIQLLASPI